MTRRFRVERAIGDHGYLPGWLVLNPDGALVAEADTQPEAFADAELLAYIDRAACSNLDRRRVLTASFGRVFA